MKEGYIPFNFIIKRSKKFDFLQIFFRVVYFFFSKYLLIINIFFNNFRFLNLFILNNKLIFIKLFYYFLFIYNCFKRHFSWKRWKSFLNISKVFMLSLSRHISKKFRSFFVNCKKFTKFFLNKINLLNFKSLKYSLILKFLYMHKKKKLAFFFNKNRSFYFRLDIKKTFIRYKKINKKFISLRLTKLFFITLTYKQFRRLGLKAKSKNGFFEQNYLILLEGRILSIVYRSSFMYICFKLLISYVMV